MRRTLRFAILLALVVSDGVAAETGTLADGETGSKREWGEPVEGQAISIATEKASYSPGERIVLNVCFKNVGENDVPGVLTSPLHVYRITVLLPNQKEAPYTLFGKAHLGFPGGGGASTSVLRPQEERCAEIDLSRLFDMSRSGKYTVVATRSVWKDGAFNKSPRASSNKLEITLENRPHSWNVPRRSGGPTAFPSPTADNAERKMAYDRIAQERQEVVARLVAIVSDEANYERHFAAVHDAMSLLGKLRAREGIDALVEHIGFPEVMPEGNARPDLVVGLFREKQGEEEAFPAVGALANIGEPCIDAVIAKLSTTENPAEIASCLLVLKRLDRPPVEARLRQAAERAKGDGKRRLQDALKRLSAD